MREAFVELARKLDAKTENAHETLEAGLEDTIAVLALPAEYRRRLQTTKRGPSSMRNGSLSEKTLAWPNGPRGSPPDPCRRHLGRCNFATALTCGHCNVFTTIALRSSFPFPPTDNHKFMDNMYRAVLDSTALASSIYVNIALAGFTLILIALWSRGIRNPRARLITYATMMISVVSISSYMGLASGLTVDTLVMPDGHALAGEETISLWGRYLTWTLSTPFILLALGLMAGSTTDKIFSAIVLDVFMCLTGLAAALTTSSYLMRWFWYLLSTAFFLGVLYYLLAEWPADAEAQGTGQIFSTLKLLTVFMWVGYPIIWALGNEGLALLDVGITSWGYSILDIIAKYLFTILLVLYVKEEPDAITSTNVAPANA